MGSIRGGATSPRRSATSRSWSSCRRRWDGGTSMAIVTIPDEHRTLTDIDAIASHLAAIGIDYERWEPDHPVADGTAPSEILDAYSAEIERLKARGGYVTADVIEIL